jgi:ubiquitin-like modifier-activating enzyme ATG7
MWAIINSVQSLGNVMPSERPPLQFESLSSAVDTSFWHALASLKLDVFKLDDAAVKIAATYGPGRVVLPADASGGPPTPMTGRLNASGSEAFALSESGDTGASVSTTPDDILARKWTPLEFASPGTLYNTNTQEEFKDADKSKLLKAAGDKVLLTRS